MYTLYSKLVSMTFVCHLSDPGMPVFCRLDSSYVWLIALGLNSGAALCAGESFSVESQEALLSERQSNSHCTAIGEDWAKVLGLALTAQKRRRGPL